MKQMVKECVLEAKAVLYFYLFPPRYTLLPGRYCSITHIEGVESLVVFISFHMPSRLLSLGW